MERVHTATLMAANSILRRSATLDVISGPSWKSPGFLIPLEQLTTRDEVSQLFAVRQKRVAGGYGETSSQPSLPSKAQLNTKTRSIGPFI